MSRKSTQKDPDAGNKKKRKVEEDKKEGYKKTKEKALSGPLLDGRFLLNRYKTSKNERAELIRKANVALKRKDEAGLRREANVVKAVVAAGTDAIKTGNPQYLIPLIECVFSGQFKWMDIKIELSDFPHCPSYNPACRCALFYILFDKGGRRHSKTDYGWKISNGKNAKTGLLASRQDVERWIQKYGFYPPISNLDSVSLYSRFGIVELEGLQKHLPPAHAFGMNAPSFLLASFMLDMCKSTITPTQVYKLPIQSYWTSYLRRCNKGKAKRFPVFEKDLSPEMAASLGPVDFFQFDIFYMEEENRKEIARILLCVHWSEKEPTNILHKSVLAHDVFRVIFTLAGLRSFNFAGRYNALKKFKEAPWLCASEFTESK